MLHRYIYIPRCLIMDCFYGPRYVSNPPFLERSANFWAHWLCASTTASYMLVYLWIFSDYYGECEMADASTYLERSNRNLHISMVCSSFHRRERSEESQQSLLAFKGTWTRSACWKRSWFWHLPRKWFKKVFFTPPLRIFYQSML